MAISVAEGGRNLYLAQIAKEWPDNFLDELEEQLLRANKRDCKPPLDDEEVKQIVRNTLAYRKK